MCEILGNLCGSVVCAYVWDTDRGHLLLLCQLLQLVRLLLCFDEAFLNVIHSLQRKGAVKKNMYISTQQKKDRHMHTPGGRSSLQQAGCHWAKSLLLWWRATCAGWGRFLGWLRYSSVYTVCGGTHWGQAYALKKRGTEQEKKRGLLNSIMQCKQQTTGISPIFTLNSMKCHTNFYYFGLFFIATSV